MNIEKIERILKQDTSIDELKNILHIPISIIYECNITTEYNELSEEYRQKIANFQKKQADQIIEKITKELNDIHNIQKINFHVILFPVPEKEKITNNFNKRLETL
ncbi:Domain of uncharacterised function (DUF1837) [Campylobacter jejuni subsp. doylei]|nr:Domain of uncharacterised function (DUF1837) [Campylobacter jejuni subsp. doylei]